MNKHFIIVPKGIRYIGEKDEQGNPKWDYKLEEYSFPHIINKRLTGCGFTEYCIRNEQNIILVSPRKFLLENKEEQHPGEVYYVRNELEASVDFNEIQSGNKPIRNLKEKIKSLSEENSGIIEQTVIDNLERLKKDLMNAYANRDKSKPFKILVTYDSFRHVKDALKHYKHDFMGNEVESDIFNQFQVVVDEFQSIFIDSRFKSDTEIELLDNLKDVQRVCYVSATPILEKYLDRLDEFKNLPYYEFDWETDDPGRTKIPYLEIRFSSSISTSINNVIESYKSGKFEIRLDPETGEELKSTEATLFMNSVKGICQAIRTNRLHIEECNVLCADTKDNAESVRKAFNEVIKREYEEKREKGLVKGRRCDRPKLIKPKEKVIGKIPVKGEPHRMFTFCTRTVYLGADFYSTCARTFVFSDSNIDCLSVDISMDLEQIIGRQRLDENPWKNTATIFIRTKADYRDMKKEDFDRYLNIKMSKTKSLLRAFDDVSKEEDRQVVADNYQRLACYEHYKENYVAVTRIRNKETGELIKLQPVFNNLVLVSEERTFDIQQVDYKDRFSVFSTLKDHYGTEVGIKDEIIKLSEEINSTSNVCTKLKMIVGFSEKEGVDKKDIEDLLELLPGKYKDYYTLLGPDRIRANSYQESEIRKEWRRIVSNGKVQDDVDEKILSTFEPGKRYGKSNIKETLNKLYRELGFEKTAKATDLELYYVMKPVKFQDSSGKWIHGFEILGRR